jgi:hypothetical protein
VTFAVVLADTDAGFCGIAFSFGVSLALPGTHTPYTI